jgi:uncharacterized protein YjbI with pentapeptide repeats
VHIIGLDHESIVAIHFRVTFRNLIGSRVLGKGHARYPVLNMANEEHLKLINQGVDAWNEWMCEHEDTRPDLSGANLSCAVLRRADLIEANLSGARLSEADLSSADLTHVRLAETYVDNANLNGCRIYGISAWNLKGVSRDQLDLMIPQEKLLAGF